MDIQSTRIPIFPNFINVTLETKLHFDEFVNKFEVYSDFNFNSFYAWDVEKAHGISQLDGNLVLRFTDYVTSEPFFSLIGSDNIEDSIEKLLSFSESNGFGSSLKLVPECVVRSMSCGSNFSVQEDRDNFDYVFSLKELSELQGNKFKSKRQAAQKCEQFHDLQIFYELKKEKTAELIVGLLEDWKVAKVSQGKEVDMAHEVEAITRLVESFDFQTSLVTTFVTKKDRLVGFSIDEILPHKYVLSHYFKTLPDVLGLSEYLNKVVAKNLLLHNCEYWNWEQDLGIESLRVAKLSYRPVYWQNKYIIARK